MDPLHAMVTAIVRDALDDGLEFDGAHGTMRVHDLVVRVRESLGILLDVDIDAGRAEDVVRDILYAPGPITALGDGRVVDLESLIAGVGLRHRLTAAEIEGDHLDLHPDLSALAEIAAGDGGLHDQAAMPLHLKTGYLQNGAIGEATGLPLRDHRLAGPPGWLKGHRAGDVVRVTVHNAMVGIDAAEAAVPDDAACGGVLVERDTCEPGDVVDGTPTDIARLQAAGIVDAWWPTGDRGPCFGDVLEGAGLIVMGDQAGDQDSGQHLAELTEVVAPLARAQHLESGSFEVFSDAIRPWHNLAAAPIEPPPAPSGLVRALAADPDLVVALERELRIAVEERPDGPELIERYLDALPATSGRPGLGVAALRARHALARGDLAEAERLARTAASIDPFHWVGTEVLAHLAAHRGALREVVSLLSTVRDPDDAELVLLRSRLARLEPDVGRNQSCPCGSGRKFKQCHLGRAELTGADAVAWLLEQARDFVQLVAPWGLLHGLGRDLGSSDEVQLLVQDEVLFGQGWLRRFVEVRGAALSEDFRTLTESWIDGNRSGLFTVAAKDETGARFVEMATDDELPVGPSQAPDSAAVGSTVWVRLLPARGRWWTAGLCATIAEGAADAVASNLRAAEVDGRGRIEVVLGLAPGTTAPPLAADGHPKAHASCRIDHSLDADTLQDLLDRRYTIRADHVGPLGWSARSSGGVAVRLTVMGLALRVVLEKQVDPADLPPPPMTLDISVSGTSIPAATEVAAEVERLLAEAGGSPVRGPMTVHPWRSWEAMRAEEDLLAAISRAELGDDGWDDDWDEDDAAEDLDI